MEGQGGRPVGRGRSKARGGPVPQTQQPPPPTQSAWGSGRRPGSSQESPESSASYGPPTAGRSVRPINPASSSQGDRPPGVSRIESSSSAAVPVGGSGDASTSAAIGRGAMRGRRIINSDSMMTRPSHKKNSKSGSNGTPITLQANYFKILSAPDWCLFQYRVDFDTEEDRMPIRKALLRLHKEKLGTYLFDGTVLYTCVRLPNVTQDQKLELVSKRASDEKIIVISIRLVGDLVKGDPHYLQLYNIVMRKGLEHLKLQLVGRNYFDAHARVIIPNHGFELWPGYLTTIRQHERGVLMGVEITHKIMRQQTVMNILNEIRQTKPKDLTGECKRAVVGLTVLTDYNNNTYRVDDLDFNVNPQTKFPHKKSGTDISYLQYYQERYGLRINNATQPLLLSRSTVRDRRAGKDELVYLIPELCRATGITDSMKSDFTLMREMSNHTRITPKVRIDKLMAFNHRLASEPNVVSEFSQWNLGLDRSLVGVPGRILPGEKIIFANGKILPTGDRADWTQQLRNAPFIVTARLAQWTCLVPERLVSETRGFITQLITAAKGMSFRIEPPNVVSLGNDSAQSYAQKLEELLSRNTQQMVLCISMRPRADIYSAIKKKCCCDRPVPSQVFLAKHFRNSKGLMSIATKVAIQMNCKIGGAPWSCNHNAEGSMIVGFDVCHDPRQRGTDIGAMVATLDDQFSRYFSAISLHSSNEELTNDFGVNMVKAVRKYQEQNRAYPERIIIYRDGVGDGQIPFVVEHEVGAIRKALAEFYGSPEQVRLTFILVTKRINTRFFFKGNNPPPGTVVDDVVTNPNRYDFFIVAQNVGQGSVSPTAYNVIDDNGGYDVNTLQSLTFKMTHMYFNWSGTVRVPAPCQYAHKLAFLVSQSIHSKPSHHLETLLYFL